MSSGMVAGDEQGRGWVTASPPQRLLLSASEADQARQTHREQRWCLKAIFMLFCLSPQFQTRVGGSLHHQQQPFFFWGSFGTSSALFFSLSSLTLSNLIKLTMDSETLWPEAALHS